MNVISNLGYMARRFKTATALNLLGLTTAFAVFYLLMTQVDYNRSYNRYIPDAERVYRVESMMNSESRWGILNNRPMVEMIRHIPQVEAVTLTGISPWPTELSVGETKLMADVIVASEPFAAMCTRCVDGELSFTEDEHQSQGVIIPVSMAEKLFGRADVAGRYVRGWQDSIVVRGVYEDFPDNCSMGNYIYINMGDTDREDYSEWSYIAYIKLREGVDRAALEKEFPSFMRQTIYDLTMGRAIESGEMKPTDEGRAEFDRQFDQYFSGQNYRLRPITETYFSGVDPNKDKGNPAMLIVLELACVLVMVIAAINFLNFTLAESPMRIKGINTRRVLGEGLWRLRLGLVAESVLIALVACVLALVACAVVESQPMDLLQGPLSLGEHRWLVASMLALAVAIGVATGVYPAFFATSFEPALALKGSFGLTPRGRRLRTALVGLQLFVSMLLVCYIGILMLQSRYIFSSDYGYDKDEVLYADISKFNDRKDAMRTELLQLSGVENVSFSRFPLGVSDTYMGWGRADDDHTVTFTCLPVDCHYLKTMGIRIVEGRDFNEHDSDCYIINEAARRAWPWVEIGKPLLSGDMPVVGICEDVRYGSVRVDRSAEPVAFIIMGERYKDWGNQLGIVSIRINAKVNKVEMRQKVTQVLRSFAESGEVEVKFLDQRLEQLYEDEFRFIRQVIVFSTVCLLITLIGVFCLTMFETEYRRKEIGIRKIMGSSTAEVLQLLCRRYVWLLALSFVVAAPLAWYIGHEWLQSFAERTPIYWWLFPVALLAVTAVTMLTVVVQSWRTANDNPINSIKCE